MKYANSYAVDFEIAARAFYARTGIKAIYEKQYGNGSYLWILDDQNCGYGFEIEVRGYQDAIVELTLYEAKLNGFDLDKLGGLIYEEA